MERQIKFRAFHKPSGRVYDIHTLHWNGNGEIIGGYLHNEINEEIAFEIKDVILMQLTGLLDKNGKEIWEGDILNKKTTFENNMADRRFQPDTEIVVSFNDGCFIDDNTGVVLFEKMRTVSSYKQKYWTDYEIIGNRSENPELINN